MVPAICSVKAGSGTIRLTGYTDHGEGVDLGVQGEGAFNVVCNTPYALGVHRQLRRIVPYHHHRDHRGRPRVEAPSGTHEITTASITPSPVPEPARSSLSALDLGIDLQVSGNGEVQTSSCLLGPLPERIEGALLPGTAPCGVRSALDDASRPMARVQALVIVTGSIARSPAPESPALAASGYPEWGPRSPISRRSCAIRPSCRMRRRSGRRRFSRRRAPSTSSSTFRCPSKPSFDRHRVAPAAAATAWCWTCARRTPSLTLRVRALFP
ncbi:MAG: hypothetical protein R3D44_16235 [Hyphomicrobiaceae bacterium]